MLCHLSNIFSATAMLRFALLLLFFCCGVYFGESRYPFNSARIQWAVNKDSQPDFCAAMTFLPFDDHPDDPDHQNPFFNGSVALPVLEIGLRNNCAALLIEANDTKAHGFIKKSFISWEYLTEVFMLCGKGRELCDNWEDTKLDVATFFEANDLSQKKSLAGSFALPNPDDDPFKAMAELSDVRNEVEPVKRHNQAIPRTSGTLCVDRYGRPYRPLLPYAECMMIEVHTQDVSELVMPTEPKDLMLLMTRNNKLNEQFNGSVNTNQCISKYESDYVGRICNYHASESSLFSDISEGKYYCANGYSYSIEYVQKSTSNRIPSVFDKPTFINNKNFSFSEYCYSVVEFVPNLYLDMNKQYKIVDMNIMATGGELDESCNDYIRTNETAKEIEIALIKMTSARCAWNLKYQYKLCFKTFSRNYVVESANAFFTVANMSLFPDACIGNSYGLVSDGNYCFMRYEPEANDRTFPVTPDVWGKIEKLPNKFIQLETYNKLECGIWDMQPDSSSCTDDLPKYSGFQNDIKTLSRERTVVFCRCKAEIEDGALCDQYFSTPENIISDDVKSDILTSNKLKCKHGIGDAAIDDPTLGFSCYSHATKHEKNYVFEYGMLNRGHALFEVLNLTSPMDCSTKNEIMEQLAELNETGKGDIKGCKFDFEEKYAICCCQTEKNVICNEKNLIEQYLTLKIKEAEQVQFSFRNDGGCDFEGNINSTIESKCNSIRSQQIATLKCIAVFEFSSPTLETSVKPRLVEEDCLLPQLDPQISAKKDRINSVCSNTIFSKYGDQDAGCARVILDETQTMLMKKNGRDASKKKIILCCTPKGYSEAKQNILTTILTQYQQYSSP